MADADKDPADEPDTSATPDEPETDTDARSLSGSESADDGEPETNGGTDDADDRELVPAGRAESRTARTADEDASSKAPGRAERSKKDKPTPKQTRDAEVPQRTGPVTLVRQSVGELRKVVYPTGSQLANYFVVVLIFVLFVIAYVSLLDLGIGAAIFRIFA